MTPCVAHRWCQLADGHDKPCRRVLADFPALDLETGRVCVLRLDLEGSTNRTRGLVVTLKRTISADEHESRAGMSWPQASSLSRILADAIRRWGA